VDETPASAPFPGDPPLHGDPGLQPERTALAWGRTVLTMIAASAICLRWLPEQGLFVLTMFGLIVAAGSAIYFTQRQRYRRSVEGIRAGHLAPDMAAVFWTAGACIVLGALGVWLVLV
jgi:hypothetical protein